MSNRRLAAIMFTDIAGYTAMMQQDEAKALAVRKRHREVFEREHERYRGQIVQYYGDGTLSVFDSAIDAAACAVAMQAAFREEPQVPLRIGIHTGDILISETEVIGDGVNVASRVESLGVPGCVLVSETVYDNLKNQPEFSGESLGIFTFKNVSKPIEVFALKSEGLIVPSPKQLGGKFTKRVSADGDWFQRLPIWAKYVAGFVLFLAVAPFIYAPILSLFDASASPDVIRFTDAQGNQVTREIIPASERRTIYLTTFTNAGDSTLDWTTVGVPYALEMDLDQEPYVTNYYEERETFTSLNKQLEAARKKNMSHLLRGSVSQNDAGWYILSAKVHQVPSGQVIKTIDLSQSDLLPLVDSLTIALKQVLAVPDDPARQASNLPLTDMLTTNPEAYQAYIQGIKGLTRLTTSFFDDMERAVELDSTFAWASFNYANLLHYFQRTGSQKQQFLNLALRHQSRLPDIFSIQIRQLNYKVQGQPEKALELLQLMTQLEPGKPSHWTSLLQESYMQGKYEMALEALKGYRQVQGDQDFQQLMEAGCYYWLGEFDQGLKVIDQYLANSPEDKNGLATKGELLLGKGKPEEALRVFQRLNLLFPEEEPYERMVQHCKYAIEHGPFTKEDAEAFLGEYWVATLSNFHINVGYELGHLSFQAKDQQKFLMYRYDDLSFGMPYPAKIDFRRDTTTGEVLRLRLQQANQATFVAIHIDPDFKAAFESFDDGDEAVANQLREEAPKHRYGDILNLMADAIEYQHTEAFEQGKARYESYTGRYSFMSEYYQVLKQADDLYISIGQNNQGFDPFRLYEFEPGAFFLKENMTSYLRFDPGTDGLALQYFEPDTAFVLPRLP